MSYTNKIAMNTQRRVFISDWKAMFYSSFTHVLQGLNQVLKNGCGQCWKEKNSLKLVAIP